MALVRLKSPLDLRLAHPLLLLADRSLEGNTDWEADGHRVSMLGELVEPWRKIGGRARSYARGGEHIELDVTTKVDTGDGLPGAAGVCGGQMRLALRRWHGPADQQRADALAATLASGASVQLSAEDAGHPLGAVRVDADPRLLIVGGGHCGHALYELARYVDFEQWIFDPRPEYAEPARRPP